jgi:hypothetical protein
MFKNFLKIWSLTQTQAMGTATKSHVSLASTTRSITSTSFLMTLAYIVIITIIIIITTTTIKGSTALGWALASSSIS